MNGRSYKTFCQMFGAAIATISFLVACASATTPTSCSLHQEPIPDLPKSGISAHRGGKMGCPGNTIGAFQRAICRGVHQIELDVRATANDVIVVAHDDYVKGQNKALFISGSTWDQVRKIELASCTGKNKKPEHIPTLEEVLAIMPHNMWINVDIKNNDPHVGKLVAQTVGQAQRFHQVIFAARDKAIPAIRQVAKENDNNSWIANMNRQLFRCQYVEGTLNSCSEFIQLVELPFLPFVRGKPSQETMNQLKNAGVRVNYSWLREENEKELKKDLKDLFDRKVDFVLVDHVEPAMRALDSIGISPLAPHWGRTSLPSNQSPFSCPSIQ